MVSPSKHNPDKRKHPRPNHQAPSSKDREERKVERKLERELADESAKTKRQQDERQEHIDRLLANPDLLSDLLDRMCNLEQDLDEEKGKVSQLQSDLAYHAAWVKELRPCEWSDISDDWVAAFTPFHWKASAESFFIVFVEPYVKYFQRWTNYSKKRVDKTANATNTPPPSPPASAGASSDRCVCVCV
jgi:hypothetical protein